ncbi:MAG: ABC transporter ATP-binding protein [Sphaerochaetaceae bacterium]
MIKINHLTKSYDKGKRPAVSELSLEVKAGEIFGFLGPNGAGKSTTINIMVGKIVQDSGSIEIDGLDTFKASLQTKKIIGYVPDEPNFYEKMSGREHLNFICNIFHCDNAPLETWAATFELTAALDDEIASYSRGMKQKLAIVAAFIHNPKLLVLDEPMVGLDPKAAFNLKEAMRHFCVNGGTVFFSTHVMEVAEKICDRIGIINRGRLLASGSVKELRNFQSESLEQLFLELTNEG